MQVTDSGLVSPCRNCQDRPKKGQCKFICGCDRVESWRRTQDYSHGLGQTVVTGRFKSSRRYGQE